MQEPAIIPSPEPIGNVVDGVPEPLVAPEEPVSDVAHIENAVVTVGDDQMAVASTSLICIKGCLSLLFFSYVLNGFLILGFQNVWE